MSIRKRSTFPLYIKILIGMVAGVVAGFVLLNTGLNAFTYNWIAPWGRLFIRLLQLVAIPLVFVSLVKGVMGLKDASKLSKMGLKTILIYIGTTFFAVSIGLGLGLLVRPGKLVDRERVESFQEQYMGIADEKVEKIDWVQEQSPLSFLDEIVPENFFLALTGNGKMLQIIFFALFFGVAAISIPRERVQPLVQLFDTLNEVILKMIDIIIKLAPFGVACLMAGLVVDFEGEGSIFSALGVYALTVISGLFILMFGFYPVLVRLFSRMPVKKFLKGIYPVQLFAFSTSSSAATLPITIETVERDLKVSEETASFVLPLGATINMDGTSCYQAIAVLFIAQLLGIDLETRELLTILLITVLSSIGTPSIPGGSYVILAMVLTTAGIPAEGLALILGIDRPLDMVRTAVNVTGDATVAVLVDQ